MRDNFFFEKTRLSWEQILYIEFCNKVMPGLGLKFFKQQLLPDLMKHCQKLTYGNPASTESAQASRGSENDHINQKYRSSSPSLAHNLRFQSQIYFINNSIFLINEHCTYQDEELALSLMDIIDNLKDEDLDCSQDEEKMEKDEPDSQNKHDSARLAQAEKKLR